MSLDDQNIIVCFRDDNDIVTSIFESKDSLGCKYLQEIIEFGENKNKRNIMIPLEMRHRDAYDLIHENKPITMYKLLEIANVENIELFFDLHASLRDEKVKMNIAHLARYMRLDKFKTSREELFDRLNYLYCEFGYFGNSLYSKQLIEASKMIIAIGHLVNYHLKTHVRCNIDKDMLFYLTKHCLDKTIIKLHSCTDYDAEIIQHIYRYFDVNEINEIIRECSC